MIFNKLFTLTFFYLCIREVNKSKTKRYFRKYTVISSSKTRKIVNELLLW